MLAAEKILMVLLLLILPYFHDIIQIFTITLGLHAHESS